MPAERTAAPDGTALRVALWRALHVQVDPPPHVLEDEVGLLLAAPEEGWRQRPDMDAEATRRAPRLHRCPRALHRGSRRGTGWPWHWPVRHPRRRSRYLRPTQTRNRLRLANIRGRPTGRTGLEAAAPDRHRIRHPRISEVRAGRFRNRLVLVGEARDRRLRFGSADHHGLLAGVTMYLQQGCDHDDAAPGRRARPRLHAASCRSCCRWNSSTHKSAPSAWQRSRPRRLPGTPFISFFSPTEMLALARDAGFRQVEPVSASSLAERYFAGRTDGSSSVERRGAAGRDDLSRRHAACFSLPAASSACERSARMSSICSMPIGQAHIAVRNAGRELLLGGSCECVVEAG